METRNIYQRMVEVQKRVLTVMKNEKIEMKGERGYKGVTHDDVAALLHLPLAEAGIVLLPNVTEFLITEFQVEKNGYNNQKYIQKWYRTDLKVTVKWINADKPEEFIESNGGAFALDTSDKGFAKAYSLALKIILLKVHLLESRDGEEQRTFENEQAQNEGTPPATQSKTEKKAKVTPAAKPKPNNSAPANQELMEKVYDLAMQRDVLESELIHLVKEGYGFPTDRNPPTWVALEIGELLSNEDTNSATIMAQVVKIQNRREAARLAKEGKQ